MGIEETIAGIRDADLRAELEAARGGFLFAQIAAHLLHRQKERDALQAAKGLEEARRAEFGRDQRRRDAVRLVIENEPALPENLQHIHSVLALCGLPYRDPGAVREFSRTYGRNSLNLIAGRLKDPATGAFLPQGLPYGPKARLMLLHLCTEAVRQRSAVVQVADTLSGFMREMGFAVTGGERGTIRQFKEQLNRLAACTMQIGLWDGRDSATTLNVPPFRSLELWRARPAEGHDEGGETLDGARTVRFDQEFYETLIRHALPVDMRAAKAFSGSARKLDLLFWLGYRLRALPGRCASRGPTCTSSSGRRTPRSAASARASRPTSPTCRRCSRSCPRRSTTTASFSRPPTRGRSSFRRAREYRRRRGRERPGKGMEQNKEREQERDDCR